jgi:hypothetical protein
LGHEGSPLPLAQAGSVFFPANLSLIDSMDSFFLSLLWRHYIAQMIGAGVRPLSIYFIAGITSAFPAQWEAGQY